jgi:16S rRNA (cytidine1402-2'-O)-methyltransferase
VQLAPHKALPTAFAPGLYVVATPIGNLADLSARAAAVLAAASVVAAEDTRTSGPLVRTAGGNGRMLSLTEHNVGQRVPGLIEAARAGVVALVSDAGTPVVADPGARLVDAALEAGVNVVAIPGPSALAAAVSVAGFGGEDVHFLGFLPRAKGDRRTRLEAASTTAAVLVFFESPNRLAATLGDVAETLGNPRVAVCRELTKVYEEVVRARARELATRFAGTKGECTVVVEVKARPLAEDEEVALYMSEMQRAGARRSAAAAEAAKRFGVTKERAYAHWEG